MAFRKWFVSRVSPDLPSLDDQAEAGYPARESEETSTR